MSLLKNNRFYQRTHTTYKNKNDILEALHLIKPYINESTYKFLKHFLHTNGSGVTQAKITEICRLAGISVASYSMTVKHEIENTFDQALIIKTPAPMKYDFKRMKKVKASEYKSLLPLRVIKSLVAKKQAAAEQEAANFYNQIDIEVDIEIDIESNPSIPCESKDESSFFPQQNKSFRVNPLEKDLNLVNKNSVNNHQKIVDDLVFKYMQKGLDKKLCFKVISEIMPGGKIPAFIENVGGYIQKALKNTLYKSNIKHGVLDPREKIQQRAVPGTPIIELY